MKLTTNMMKRLGAIALATVLVTGLAKHVQADDAAAIKAGEATGKPDAGNVVEPAPSKEWSVTLGMDYYTEYIFRGVDLSSSQPLFSPSAIAKYKGFAFSYYGYYCDGQNPNNTWYQETDLSLDYTKTFFNDKLAVTGGAVYYWYPDGNSGADTWELYGKATWSCYVNPYIALNWDIDEFHGGYGAVGINHSYDLTSLLKLKDGQTLAIVPSAQLGIDFGYNSRATQSNVNWNDVLLGVSVPFNITPALSIHAGIQVSIAMNSLNDIGQHNDCIGNVGISYGF